MPYCSSCGNEIDGDNAFCPNCGNEINQPTEAQQSQQTTEIEGETGSCVKCDSVISVEADRCPECGHEPASTGILGGLFSIIALLWAGLGIILILAAFGVLFTGGYSVGNFILALVLFTAFTLPPVIYLYGMYKSSQVGPTERVELFGKEFGGES
jgi:RNA polymerase subunit RPABC4/transcription elongation factor Spt4